MTRSLSVKVSNGEKEAQPLHSKHETQPSAGKVTLSIFWDSKGVLLIDFLPHKQTINGEYYANLVHKLQDALIDKSEV